MLNRRQTLSGLVAGSAILASSGTASAARNEGQPRLAITIDDFNVDDGPLLDGEAKDAAILGALKVAGIQAAGFPAGKFIDNDTGQRRLEAWSSAGHAIGNHTYRHAYYGGATPGDLAADIDQAAPLLSAHKTYRPWFRFPYLAEGRSIEARDAMRAELTARGLTNAHVTLDASDWYVNNRLVQRLKRDPGADIAPYRAYYVQHLLERAAFYDQLARDVIGRSPPHTLLIHHNLTTALFLPALLKAFSEGGWAIIDADAAFADPVYASKPDIAPAAHSVIWQLAKADGRFEHRLRSPGEDGSYEKPAMDALSL